MRGLPSVPGVDTHQWQHYYYDWQPYVASISLAPDQANGVIIRSAATSRHPERHTVRTRAHARTRALSRAAARPVRGPLQAALPPAAFPPPPPPDPGQAWRGAWLEDGTPAGRLEVSRAATLDPSPRGGLLPRPLP